MEEEEEKVAELFCGRKAISDHNPKKNKNVVRRLTFDDRCSNWEGYSYNMEIGGNENIDPNMHRPHFIFRSSSICKLIKSETIFFH